MSFGLLYEEAYVGLSYEPQSSEIYPLSSNECSCQYFGLFWTEKGHGMLLFVCLFLCLLNIVLE